MDKIELCHCPPVPYTFLKKVIQMYIAYWIQWNKSTMLLKQEKEDIVMTSDKKI